MCDREDIYLWIANLYFTACDRHQTLNQKFGVAFEKSPFTKVSHTPTTLTAKILVVQLSWLTAAGVADFAGHAGDCESFTRNLKPVIARVLDCAGRAGVNAGDCG